MALRNPGWIERFSEINAVVEVALRRGKIMINKCLLSLEEAFRDRNSSSMGFSWKLHQNFWKDGGIHHFKVNTRQDWRSTKPFLRSLSSYRLNRGPLLSLFSGGRSSSAENSIITHFIRSNRRLIHDPNDRYLILTRQRLPR